MSDYTQSLSLALRSAPPLAVEVLPKDDGVARREWQTRVWSNRTPRNRWPQQCGNHVRNCPQADK